MKRKLFVVVLLVVGFLGVLVVEGISQPVPPPNAETGTRSAPSPLSPATPVPVYGAPSPGTLPAVAVQEPNPNFSVVQPQQQEWTFEQLVEALKGVRGRQKELQKQEADLLAKLAQKVEEKRRDLSRSESTLQQLRSENAHVHPTKTIIGMKKGIEMRRDKPAPPPPPPLPGPPVQ